MGNYIQNISELCNYESGIEPVSSVIVNRYLILKDGGFITSEIDMFRMLKYLMDNPDLIEQYKFEFTLLLEIADMLTKDKEG